MLGIQLALHLLRSPVGTERRSFEFRFMPGIGCTADVRKQRAGLRQRYVGPLGNCDVVDFLEA